MLKTLVRVQSELQPWQFHNFGDRPSWQPLLGLSEEVGELMEVYMSETSEDYETYDKQLDDMKDAVADITIYLTDFCNSMKDSLRFNIVDIYGVYCNISKIHPTSGWASAMNISISIGRLNHAYLKHMQGVRVSENHHENMRKSIGAILYALHEFCLNMGFDLESVVNYTWNQVKERDWKAFPKNGITQ